MNAIARMGAVIAAASIILILILITIEVILRPLRMSLLFTDEVVGYLNVAVIFLGMLYSLRTGSFIRLDMIYLKFRERRLAYARIIISIMSIIFFSILLYYSATYALYSYEHHLTSIGLLRMPVIVPQIVIVLGVVMVMAQLIAWIFGRLRDIP